jgi:predicted metal-binding protein
MYGTNLCCPPYAPTAEETQSAVDDYNYALLIKFKTIADVKKLIPEIERTIFLDGKYKAFGFKAGSCGYARSATSRSVSTPAKQGQQWRRPELMSTRRLGGTASR